MKKPVIKFDALLCVRCKRCQVQCAVLHNSKTGNLYEAMFETPAPLTNIQIKLVGGMVASASSCRHCEGDTAYCITNCPTGAIFRDEDSGLVLQDESKCIYCGNCVTVCPYGAPRLRIEKKEKRLFKCDLCFDRRKEGKLPACVEACHTGALKYEEIDTDQEQGDLYESLDKVAQALSEKEVFAGVTAFLPDRSE